MWIWIKYWYWNGNYFLPYFPVDWQHAWVCGVAPSWGRTSRVPFSAQPWCTVGTQLSAGSHREIAGCTRGATEDAQREGCEKGEEITPNHYLNLCWPSINYVLWHSHESKFWQWVPKLLFCVMILKIIVFIKHSVAVAAYNRLASQSQAKFQTTKWALPIPAQCAAVPEHNTPLPFICHFDSQESMSVNSLWPSNVIWSQGSRSTLAQVMACCLMAPSHCLNQCWLIISEVLWYLPDSNFIENTSDIYCWNEFEIY